MPHTNTKLPSNRAFGILFVGVFAILACYGYFRNWQSDLVKASFILSVTLLLITLFAQRTLTPFNKAWYQLGLLLGRVISPLVLGVLFFVVITPVAFFMRLIGRDALRIKKQAVLSYWIKRDPPGPKPESFKDQF